MYYIGGYTTKKRHALFYLTLIKNFCLLLALFISVHYTLLALYLISICIAGVSIASDFMPLVTSTRSRLLELNVEYRDTMVHLKVPTSELITGPVFTVKGCIRPFLGYLGRFWPVFGSQRQYS